MTNKLKLLLLLLLLATGVMAQENIHFVAGAPRQDGISDKVKNAMKLKVEQILARNNAGANSLYNAFIIEPELTITDTRSTEGLVRDVTVITGQFSLTAKNRYDESIYGNVIIEVNGDATGNHDAALAALLNGIKSNNPAFLRFIRTTRNRIVAYYENNCETIMRKAQTMINMQQYDEAMGYLSSVPETVKCYVEATQLLETSFSGSQVVGCDKKLRAARGKFILKDYAGALNILQDISSSSPCGDDALALIDSIAKYIEFDTPTEVIPVEVPVIQLPEPEIEEPEPVAPPVVEETPQYKVTISCSDLQFELISCEGNPVTQMITLQGRFTNTGAGDSNVRIYLGSIITPDGNKLSIGYNYSNEYGNPMPTGIKLAKKFEIPNVTQQYPTIAYLEWYVDRCLVTIRDLPVVWK